MALFDDAGEANVARAVSLVEQTIAALGVDPSVARVKTADGSHGFSLKRGSASILVAICPSLEGASEGTLRVIAPVIHLPAPARHAALFRWLLEANAKELVGQAFAVLGEEVVLVSERSLRDLDASEVEHVVRAVGRAADRFDDLLAKEYDTIRASEPRAR